MSINPKNSFTSADAFPIKLFQNGDLIKTIVEKRIIPPIHVQIIPTNRCNLKCSFCSCAKEDRELEMSESDMLRLLMTLQELGTKSLTITGGGEPLLYPSMGLLVKMAETCDMSIGLVTNGLLFGRTLPGIFDRLTWCRISHGDEREAITPTYADMLRLVIREHSNVDWAFSYVVSSQPSLSNMTQVINLAEELKFTHIRFVADLLQPKEVPMELVRNYVQTHFSHVKVPIIFQDRNEPEQGHNCRIGYLKPLIGPNMKVYACCGVQYALQEPSLSLPEELCMGRVDDLPYLMEYHSQESFPGGKHCVRCYYGNYNRALDSLLSHTIHKEFI